LTHPVSLLFLVIAASVRYIWWDIWSDEDDN